MALPLFQVLAICDYNPMTSSASTNPEFELQFKEGDLIKIFGEKMEDGFCIGEVRTLVSIFFPVS